MGSLLCRKKTASREGRGDAKGGRSIVVSKGYNSPFESTLNAPRCATVSHQVFRFFFRFLASADRFFAAAFDAFVALAFRWSAVKALARALPPFRPIRAK
jgi:hypothetical protein